MARRRYKKSSSGMGKVIGALLLLGLVGGGAYVYTSPEFEQVKPTISGANNIYWNLKSPIKLTFSDNEALKSYEVAMSDGVNSIVIGRGQFAPNTKTQTLQIPYPKNRALDKKSPNLTITAKVTDASK